MFAVSVTTDIAAPASAVWSQLVELHRFWTWNPFIRNASGDPSVGGTVHLRVRPSLPVPLAFDAEVYARDERRELRWRGHFLAPWLAQGDHAFRIEPVDASHVRLVQEETFSGLLARLARPLIAREARRGFERMNNALAARAEVA